MPSFLSKVFGRKKDGKDSPASRGRGSVGSLLDGKFEVVSPTVSPTAAEFPENVQRRNGKERDPPFGLFKVKSRQSRPSSPEPKKKKKGSPPPQLPLVLPVPKGDAQARALGVVFEADANAQVLSEDVIGSRRLTPLEVLILVRTCSQAIVARGLQTLGIMHPHWYSGSPDTQRRLISLFIHSLNPNNAITTLSPSSSFATSIFNSEINYTHSPHDVAAVLRWGLRHLELDGRSFGKDESWYKTFAEAERSSGYPPSTYSETLAPLVPPAHLELINTTLDLFSSLAAHAEENGTSGSKLAKAFGLWLLAAQRIGENDDWPKFYARWQDNGRILEHLFLARIRDESLRLRMPTRLSELVAQYPFARGSTAAGDTYLRPQLSTRHFDALFVRVETEFSSPQEKARRHPLQLLKDALAADVAVDANEFSTVWEKIKKSGNDENSASSGTYPGISDVFADETIRYLALIPGNHPFKKVASPIFNISETLQDAPTSRRWASSPSSAKDDGKLHSGITNGHVKPASEPSPLSPTSLPADWAQFSSAGFSDVSPSVAPLASTLFGQDVEKTNPPFQKPSKHSRVSSSSRTPSATRKSVEVARPRDSDVSQSEIPKLVSKSMPVAVVQVDEAFIEFWIDALLDPISSTWPRFLLCKLKPPFSDLTIGDKRIQYVVIEHAFTPKPSPPARPPAELTTPLEVVSTPEKSFTSSPRSSTKAEKRFFGFFSTSGRNSGYGSDKSSNSTSKGKKRVPPQARASELGEMVKQDEDKPSTAIRLRIPSPKPRKSADISRKSLDASRQSMDAPKSTEVPNVVDKVSVKTEQSPGGRPAIIVASTLAGDVDTAAAPSSAAQDKPIVSLPADEAPKVVSRVTEYSIQPLEEAQVFPPEGNSLAEQDATTFVAPGAVRVEQQPRPSSTITIATAASTGHTLTAIVEKVEEATYLPTPELLPSIEPSGDKALGADVPDTELETSVPSQIIDVLVQKEAPTSLPVEIVAPTGTSEPPSPEAITSRTKLEEAPELPAEIINSEHHQRPSSDSISDTTPEEPKEEIVQAETILNRAMEPAVTHIDVNQPSVQEVSVDPLNDNPKQSTTEVAMGIPATIESYHEPLVNSGMVQKEVDVHAVNEERPTIESVAAVTLPQETVVGEESRMIEEGQDVARGPAIQAGGAAALDQDAAVGHSYLPEESVAIVEHSTPVPEKHVLEESPDSKDRPIDSLNQSTDVEEPIAPAAAEGLVDAEASIREESVLQIAGEPVEMPVTAKETNKIEPVVEEDIPRSAPEVTDTSGHVLVEEQPADPIAIQETAGATEGRADLIQESSIEDVTSASQDINVALEPQPTDSASATKGVAEPIPEPIIEEIEPAPHVTASAEAASDATSHEFARPSEDSSVMREPVLQAQTEANAGVDEMPAPNIIGSKDQLADNPSDQGYVVPENEAIPEAITTPSPRVDSTSEPQESYLQTSTFSAEHDSEPIPSQDPLTQPVVPSELATEVLEIAREE